MELDLDEKIKQIIAILEDSSIEQIKQIKEVFSEIIQSDELTEKQRVIRDILFISTKKVVDTEKQLKIIRGALYASIESDMDKKEKHRIIQNVLLCSEERIYAWSRKKKRIEIVREIFSKSIEGVTDTKDQIKIIQDILFGSPENIKGAGITSEIIQDAFSNFLKQNIKEEDEKFRTILYIYDSVSETDCEVMTPSQKKDLILYLLGQLSPKTISEKFILGQGSYENRNKLRHRN